MAKRPRTIHEAVEDQIGQCRAAAISIDEALRHEETPDPLLVECACLFRSVADELTKALAEGDVRRVKDLFSFSVGLATIAAPLVAIGIARYQPAHEHVCQVRDGGEANSQLIQEAEEIPPAGGAARSGVTIDSSTRGAAPTVDLAADLNASLTTTSNATATGTTVPPNRVIGTASMDYGGEVTAEGETHKPEEVGLDDTGPVHEVDWSVATNDNFAVPFGRTVVTGERPARDHERTVTDQIGVTDEVAAAVEPDGPEPTPLSAPFSDGIKDLAETAMSGVDLDSTGKGLAETVGGAVDGEAVQALAETARAVASGGNATVRPGTVRANVDIPSPTAGQSHEPPLAELVEEFIRNSPVPVSVTEVADGISTPQRPISIDEVRRYQDEKTARVEGRPPN